MYKRGIALIISILLLIAVFPVSASAATEDTKTQIRKQISRDYYKSLSASGRKSLGGYCGLLAGWQLYFMGINQGVCGFNGNRQFDYYKDMELTTGGYKTKAYSADEYTLEEALNTITDNGKRDVYNLLVGFQWTNTEAGNIYGHVVVLYAILDGMVYFTESFQTYLGAAYVGGPIVIPIDRFVKFYDDWTKFEGVIVFGNPDYIQNCIAYDCSMFGEVTQAAPIYSLPCTPEDDEAETVFMRNVVAGERLLVTGLYNNTLNQYYYCVEDDGQVGYIPAEAVQPLLELKPGSSYVQNGEVKTGIESQNPGQEKDGWVWEKDSWYYYEDGEPRTGWFCYKGVDYYLQAEGSVTTGWTKINGQDRYFSSTGAMRTGWMESEQGRCYLMSNGVKATGWHTVDGAKYYFNSSGILYSDCWFTDNTDRYYLCQNGKAATGWVDLQEGHFYFREDGHLLAKTVQNQEGTFIRAVNPETGDAMDCCITEPKTAKQITMDKNTPHLQHKWGVTY